MSCILQTVQMAKMAISSRVQCRFLLLILCWISRPVRSSQKTYPGAIYTRLNSRLKGYTFKSFVTSSQISCNQACLLNTRCSSTNFKEISQQHKGLCELNDAPPLDVISLENELHHEDGFIFALFPNNNMVRQHLRLFSIVLHLYRFLLYIIFSHLSYLHIVRKVGGTTNYFVNYAYK